MRHPVWAGFAPSIAFSETVAAGAGASCAKGRGRTAIWSWLWRSAARAKVGMPGAHALVAGAFYGPPPTPSHEVAHEDGDRGNNQAGNLRWATPAENAADRDRHGRTFEPKGILHPMAKLTDDGVLSIRAGRVGGASVTQLASAHNLSRAAVYDVLSGRTWAHL
jgi:hypothetical protein